MASNNNERQHITDRPKYIGEKGFRVLFIRAPTSSEDQARIKIKG
jgi:hypothetical protein